MVIDPNVEQGVSAGEDDNGVDIDALLQDPEIRKKILANQALQSDKDRWVSAEAEARLKTEREKGRKQQERERQLTDRKRAQEEASQEQRQSQTIQQQIAAQVAALDEDGAKRLAYEAWTHNVGWQKAFTQMQTGVVTEINKVLRKRGEKLDPELKAELATEITAEMLNNDLGTVLDEYFDTSERSASAREKDLQTQVDDLKKQLNVANLERTGTEIESEESPRIVGGARATKIRTMDDADRAYAKSEITDNQYYAYRKEFGVS